MSPLRMHRVEAAIQIRAFCDYLMDLPHDRLEEVATIAGLSLPAMRSALESGSFAYQLGLQAAVDISKYLGVEFAEMLRVR